MSIKKTAAAGLLFLVSAAVPFALLTPRTAISGVRSVSRSGGCEQPLTTSWLCAGVAGTDFLTGSLSGAYFEAIRWSNTAFTATYVLKKQSYTGTVYADSTNGSYPAGAGSVEVWVTASNVKTDASEWDFLWTEFNFSSPNAMSPLGVFYTN